MIKLVNVPSFNAAMLQAVKFCNEHIGENVEIIVPDKLSLFMEKFLVEQMNMECSFNIKVSTLNRFAKRNNVIPKEKQISLVGSIILIHKILTENINNLKALKSKVYSFSYAENIYRTIAQLKASKIIPSEMQGFKSSNAQLNDKIADLSLIYEEYENGKAGLLDSFDVFLMSALTVEKVHSNKNLLFVGFDDFTAIEYTIIERLAFNNNVNIVSYWAEGSNKHIYNQEIYNQLKSIAYINQLDFKVENAVLEQSQLKTFLQSNLFGVGKDSFCLNHETVKIYSASNEWEELEFVARDIRMGVLSGNKFNQFGVAVYGLENKVEKIKEIFAKYEINCYIDTQFSLSNSIFYKFLISVFKFNLENYNLVHLIDIINSPFFSLGLEEKGALINKLQAIKFRGKLTINLNFGEELEPLKQKLLEFIDLFIIDKDFTVSNIRAMLDNSKLSFDNILNELAETVNVDEKLILNKSKDVVYSLLDDIEKFYPLASVSEIYDILLHVASVIKINNLPLTIDAVKVVDADSCSEIFDRFYLVNCTNASAPSLKFDCGIILDSEISELNFSNKLSPTIAHINSLSKLRLFNVANMFNSAFTVTYSQMPSELIKELIARIKVKVGNGYENITAFNSFNFNNNIALSNGDYIEKIYTNSKNNEKNIKKLIKNDNLLNFNIINKKNYAEISNTNIVKEIKTISASALENYFKCPFYYFINNILKIKPRLDNDIMSLDVGNILHQILYLYYKQKKQIDDVYEFCKTQVFNFVDKDERLKININSPILTRLIDEAVRVINGVNYIDTNSAFVPYLFEFEFKGKTALNLGDVSLIGKIDRVDKCEDMLRVVDYKSGHADASLKELYYGNKLQLFLYSCVMENATKNRVVGQFYLPLHNAYSKEEKHTYSLKGFFENEEDVVKAFDNRLSLDYKKSDIVNVSLTSANVARKFGGYKELEHDEMKNLKKYSQDVSVKAIEEIKSGYIKPSPCIISKMCDYCPYVHVCLKSSNDIKYRQTNKVVPESFKGGN